MSALIYKQRFKPVNYISTPIKNAEHIRYIGTRPGVIKNEGERHGLFGNIYDADTLKIDCRVKDVMELVRQRSLEKKNIFRAVISFSPENAAVKLGKPVTKEAWEELVRQNIAVIAKENNIKMSDFKWVAAAHDTPNHPHVHIAFWDDKQEIEKNWVSPKVPAGIREKLIKNIFDEELQEFYEEWQQAEIRMKEVTSDKIREFEAYLDGLSSCEYDKLSGADFDIYDKPDGNMCEYLAKRLFDLRQQIPKGSLKFEYLKPELKGDLISLVRELVDANEDLQEVIRNYVESRLDTAKMYRSDEIELDALGDKYEKEAEKLIANKLLQLMKKFNKMEWGMKGEEFERQLRIQQTEGMVTEIFAALTRLTKQNRRDYISRKGVIGNELSKQARKEKAKELESTGWEI
ncbi:hypothetical protein LY28_03517 [Ruminiclostridium sufflavum DSM 19573]|uniref:Uncharacterized protein n=1 Tax=Ruminiclostridium sufflavum DSM 19573 TaxID=1121337 RepID=A0A318XK36_9FIRM|nr:MobP3 family relaxase [Ruminiclostridium sufflavum]PYG84896.1 hypothetical protein LY28_03517 [Ruminiclostridium sufflavum DSM 19573]